MGSSIACVEFVSRSPIVLADGANGGGFCYAGEVMAFSRPRSAYVHIPFCVHHCGYCNFAVIAGRDDLVEPLLEALEMELRGLGEPQEVETLYFHCHRRRQSRRCGGIARIGFLGWWDERGHG